METKLLTPEEAAQLKGVSRTTIYSAMADGRLPHTRTLGRLALQEADVLAWTPMKYKDRPGTGGGRPLGIPMSDDAKRRIAEAQKRRWAKRNQP